MLCEDKAAFATKGEVQYAWVWVSAFLRSPATQMGNISNPDFGLILCSFTQHGLARDAEDKTNRMNPARRVVVEARWLACLTCTQHLQYKRAIGY